MKLTLVVALALIIEVASSGYRKRKDFDDEDKLEGPNTKFTKVENDVMKTLADEEKWLSVLAHHFSDLNGFIQDICLLHKRTSSSSSYIALNIRLAPLLLYPFESVQFDWSEVTLYQDLSSFYNDVETLINLVSGSISSENLTGMIYTVYNNLKNIDDFDFSQVPSLSPIHELATKLGVDGGNYLNSLVDMNMPLWMKSLVVILRFEYRDPTDRTFVFLGDLQWFEELMAEGVKDMANLRPLLLPFFALNLGNSQLEHLTNHADNIYTIPLDFHIVKIIASSFGAKMKTCHLFDYCDFSLLKGKEAMENLQASDYNGNSLIKKFSAKSVEMLLSNRVNCRYFSPGLFSKFRNIVNISPKCFNLLPEIEDYDWTNIIVVLPDNILSEYSGKITKHNYSCIYSHHVTFLNPSIVSRPDFDITCFLSRIAAYLSPALLQNVITKYNLIITAAEWKLLFSRSFKAPSSNPSNEFSDLVGEIIDRVRKHLGIEKTEKAVVPRRRLLF